MRDWVRYTLVLLVWLALSLGLFQLLAWLPDHDASDAHAWALLAALLFEGIGLVLIRRHFHGANDA